MSPETTIQAALITPLIGAVLISLCGRWPNLRETITLSCAVILFSLVVSLYPHILAGQRPALVVGQMLPGLSIAFEVEPLGLLFACVASFLWIINSIYSIGYMRANNEKKQTLFYACFAIALASTVAIAFAGNMMTLFIFYEALTISTYPLVIHAGTEKARRGGRVYLGILLATSIGLLFLAIVWTWLIAGTLDFTPGGILEGKTSNTIIGILLALYMFGIGKAALMPFHRWLPAAMVAPTPVSALLHAVAVVKAGVFSVLKVTIYIFGYEFLADIGVSQWLQYFAAFVIITASLIALRQDNLKARLAYSTISQLSYIVLGAMLANSSGILGGGMHIATHAFAKITLFFCAGAYMVAANKTKVSELAGIGRSMPITTFAFLIASLSIIGLPPMGGMWSKWYLALGTLQADQMVLLAVLMASSLLNIAYLLPVPFKGFFSDPDPGNPVKFSEAPAFCVFALSITALGCLVLFFYPQPVYDLLLPLVGGAP